MTSSWSILLPASIKPIPVSVLTYHFGGHLAFEIDLNSKYSIYCTVTKVHFRNTIDLYAHEACILIKRTLKQAYLFTHFLFLPVQILEYLHLEKLHWQILRVYTSILNLLWCYEARNPGFSKHLVKVTLSGDPWEGLNLQVPTHPKNVWSIYVTLCHIVRGVSWFTSAFYVELMWR